MIPFPSEIIWPPKLGAADPYIDLEELDSLDVNSWAYAQTDRTMGMYGCTSGADVLTKRLVESMMAQDCIVVCSRWGNWAYNIWRDDARPLGFVRRTAWNTWIEGNPEWEVVLEVNALDLNNRNGDGTRWAMADFRLLCPTADRALVFLSPGGSDTHIVREFDVERRAFVENGFELPDSGHHSVAWIDQDTVYVSWDDSSVSADPAVTVSGYPRQVRRWKRGTSIAHAPVVFECERDDLGASANYNPIQARHIACRRTALYEAENFWLDEEAGEWRLYDVPRNSARLFEWNEWLFVTPRTDWHANETIYRGGSLLAIRHDAFIDGDRHFIVLFAPTEETALSGVHYTKRWLIVSVKSESITRVTLWRPPGSVHDIWQSRVYPLPAGCEASVTAVDRARDDTVLIYVNHFLTPPTLYYVDLSSNTPWHLLGKLPARFNSTGLVALRRHAVAPDGAQIPYWVIGREADLQGNPRPCLLYGYGGFEVPLDTPTYLGTLGFSWLEPGGVYAIASIRGGGEFGPRWHQAAQREKRQVAFDDFIAVAEALVGSGVTVPAQLAIQGGSNGGLLTAACMIQRPDLFGAVVSDVPLLDMSRFHLLLQGALWVDEYGNPDDADDCRILMAYSPYHNVKPGVSYPPVLFTSSSTDDRVHPGHARKMVAKMQALGHREVWYLEQHDGGHGAGVDPQTIARASATKIEFLRAKIGALLQPTA
ncbi:prolyl oligopeptidase family serine peptidase [Paraburkholderia youngii]|uniref:prolyl oligopeptidase family serine peptidase n=1 Tax=Paraburkholderia youngii TaxID=2782701 RepID=UPI003D19CEA9